MFGPELPGLDRDAIRDRYNGYRWLGDEAYNPFDILLLFRRRKFGAYRFETGTPAFLLDTLFRRRVSSVELDCMVGSGDLPPPSTWTTGDRVAPLPDGIPHHHRRIGSQRGAALPAGLSQPRSAAEPEPEPPALPGVRDGTRQMANSVRLGELLEKNDFEGLERLFRASSRAFPRPGGGSTDCATDWTGGSRRMGDIGRERRSGLFGPEQ